VPTLSAKLLIWLKKLAPAGDYDSPGAKTRIAERLGIDPTDITKLNKGEGLNMSLDRFEKIASHFQMMQGAPRDEIWTVLEAIAREQAPATQPAESTLPRDVHAERLKHAIENLFAADPKRGRRVFENLVAQELLNCTDLVSAIVHVLIDSMPNPKDAIVPIGNLIEQWDRSKLPKRTRSIVERYREKYEQLQ